MGNQLLDDELEDFKPKNSFISFKKKQLLKALVLFVVGTALQIKMAFYWIDFLAFRIGEKGVSSDYDILILSNISLGGIVLFWAGAFILDSSTCRKLKEVFTEFSIWQLIFIFIMSVGVSVAVANGLFILMVVLIKNLLAWFVEADAYISVIIYYVAINVLCLKGLLIVIDALWEEGD